MSDPVGAVAVIGMAGRFPGPADAERFRPSFVHRLPTDPIELPLHRFIQN